MIGCMRTIYFESENVLKFYNLEAQDHFLHFG